MKEYWINFWVQLLQENNLDYDYDELLNAVSSYKRTNPMKKCILFSRVSTQTQTLDSQTNELVAEAERQGYSKDCQIPIEYKESAISLSIDERKGIQELKEKIESDADIDLVIVYEISRLSRQTTMLHEMKDWLIERQIQLICCKPYMRLLEDGKMSQTANILFSLMSSLSESEMMIKKERMLRGRHFKREQGRYIGGRILLGYKIGKNDKIEIDYNDAETVRKIFRWYSEGKSMVWICREVISRGLVHGKWCNLNSAIAALRLMFRREEYTGKKCDTYHYPRIISDELWNKVQPLVTRNKSKWITRKSRLGKGLIHESTTGLVMSADASNYSVTRLGRKVEMTLNTNMIDEWLWKICEERAKTITKDKAQDAYIHDQQVLNNKIHTNSIQIEQLHAQIDKINERIIFGKMKEDKGDLMIKQLEQEIKKAEETHNKLTEKLLALKPTEIDMSDHHAIVHNEIEKIIARKIETDSKYKIRELETHFKDGTVKTYVYKQKAARIWIFLDDELVIENKKVNVMQNFNWYKKKHGIE